MTTLAQRSKFNRCTEGEILNYGDSISVFSLNSHQEVALKSISVLLKVPVL